MGIPVKWEPFTPAQVRAAVEAEEARTALAWAKVKEHMAKLVDNWKMALTYYGEDCRVKFIIDEEKLKMDEKSAAEIAALKVVIAAYIADNAKLGREVDSLAVTIQNQTLVIGLLKREAKGTPDLSSMSGERARMRICFLEKLLSQLKSDNQMLLNHDNDHIDKIKELKSKLLVENEKFHAQSRLRHAAEEEIGELKLKLDLLKDPTFKLARDRDLKCDQCHAMINTHVCPDALAQIVNSHLLETMWRPIAIAPKDGTSLILYHAHRGEYVGKYQKETGGWTVTGGDAINPTHWMPLTKKVPI